VLSDPSFIGSSKKISDEKRGNPKRRKGAHQKRPPVKKEATPKNTKGLIKKLSNEKSGNPKNAKGLIKKTSFEKRGNPKKRKGAH
jgi:hypothetical protein